MTSTINRAITRSPERVEHISSNETSLDHSWAGIAAPNLTHMSQLPDLSEVNEADRNFEKTITASTCDPQRGGGGWRA